MGRRDGIHTGDVCVCVREREQGQKEIPFCRSCCTFSKLQRALGWQGHRERGPQPGVETYKSQTLDSIKDPRQRASSGSARLPAPLWYLKPPRFCSAALHGDKSSSVPRPRPHCGKVLWGSRYREGDSTVQPEESCPEGRGWDKSLSSLGFPALRFGKQL